MVVRYFVVITFGPFDSQADAEEFEHKWQNRGKKNGMRSIGLHIAAALPIPLQCCYLNLALLHFCLYAAN